MNIQRWHWGKLVICWVVAGLIDMPLLYVLRYGPEIRAQSELVIVGMVWLLTMAAPLCAVVLTWKWLGGKEASVVRDLSVGRRP